MKNKHYTRYHRFDTDNIKYIKRFEIDEFPTDVPDIGYTVWIRGTGPHKLEQLNNIINGVRKACLGIPKSLQQREKMSLAKIGIPKSIEHRLNMKKAWALRRSLKLQQYLLNNNNNDDKTINTRNTQML